jgi:hypothetical protein
MRIAAFTFMILCFATEVIAQKSFSGLTGGLTIANQRTVNESSNAKTITYLGDLVKPFFGVFYQYQFSAPLALRFNAQYLQLGEKTPLDHNFKYISFPIALQYSANSHFSLSVGPYLSFLLNPNDKIAPGIVASGALLKDSYSKHDYGFYAGAEYDVYKGLALSVNYFGGLKNISLIENYTSRVTSLPTHVRLTNCVLQVGVIYKIKRRVTY